MANNVIAFLVAMGAGVWVYGKINRSTGGNTKSTLVVAGAAAVFTYVIGIMLLSLVPK